MQALIINPEIRERIAALVTYATEHPVSRTQLARTVELDAPPVGDDPRYAIQIPQGYRAVFSIEDQPAGLCRHLSVSVDEPGRVPSPESIGVLMHEFGFSTAFADSLIRHGDAPAKVEGRIWIEENRAVNVVEVIR